MKNDNTYKKEKSNKVVIIGDSNVGKTSVVKRFIEDHFGETQPTIGAMHTMKNVNGISLDIWDTAGQERYRSIIPMYYKGAKAIIIAYDITSVDSFEGAKKWLKELDSFVQKKSVSIVLIGTKADLSHLRVIKEETAKTFAESNDINYFECSSKDNININELFQHLSTKVKELNEKSHKSEVITIREYRENGHLANMKEKFTSCTRCERN